jgi:hypothetical protein
MAAADQLAPQPERPNVDQTRELLQFLREENAANRAAVREDAEASRNLLRHTVWIVSIPVFALVSIAAFLGFRSITDLKQTIRDEARRETKAEIARMQTETQAEIARMQTEIRTTLQKQFQQPTLQNLVKDAAAESTRTAAEPLIKRAVAAQVETRVDAEQGAIRNALTAETQNAVRQMTPQIDSMVKQAVASKVTHDLEPLERQMDAIRNDSYVPILITRMNADDAQAFDALRPLASNGQSPPPDSEKEIIDSALKSVSDRFNFDTYVPRPIAFRADGEITDAIFSMSRVTRRIALDTILKRRDLAGLHPKKMPNITVLRRIIDMTTADPSLAVRCAAYRVLDSWTEQTFECFNPMAPAWWEANEQRALVER